MMYREISPEISEAVGYAKIAVTMASPLQAIHMFRCQFVACDDIPTAAAATINGQNLVLLNESFFMRMSNSKKRAFVVLHEITHIFQEHGGRQTLMGYNPKLWNIATDYQNNLFCAGAYKDDNGNISFCKRYQQYIELPTYEADGIKILYDEQYIGMTSDEIYHKLLEDNDNDVQKAIEANGGGNVGDEDGMGRPSPLDAVTTDIPEKSDVLKNRMTSAGAIATCVANKSIGDSEGDIVRRLSDINKPKINWRDQLPDMVQTSVQERETYNRISRRSPDDFFFPTYTGNTIRVMFGFDSSGSMQQEDYDEVAGELKGIIEQYDHWGLDLISCDVSATVIGKYDSDENPDFDTRSFDFSSGGGTELSPMVAYAQNQHDDEPINACIIVTDGYVPVEPIEEQISGDFLVIFVVTSNGNPNLSIDGADVIFMKDIGI